MLKIYLFIFVGWVLLTLIGFRMRRTGLRRWVLGISYAVLILMCVEFACVMAFYVKNHRWTFRDEREYLSQLFEPHPYLIAAPRKNAHVSYRGISYTHNSQGFRGSEIPAKSDRLRVATIGGSTTYGAAVTDGKEWPAQLGQVLGSRYEVVNFGILGHTTAEHISLLSLIVPEYQPDILVIHSGMNDMRNINIRNLAPDYSNYHAPALYASFNLCTNNPVQKFASGKVAIFLLQKARIYPDCLYKQPFPQPDTSPQAEAHALHLYRRNLETLVSIAESQGLKPVFVPQVLIRDTVLGNRLRWWIPYVEDEAIVEYLKKYNEVTEEVATRHGLYFAREVLAQNWTKQDFADACHLNADASLRFAEIMRGVIEKLKYEDYHTVPADQKPKVDNLSSDTQKDRTKRNEHNRSKGRRV